MGIGLSLLVGSLAFAVYVHGARGLGGWQQSLSLENTAHQVLEQLAADLYRTSHFSLANDSTVLLTSVARPPVTYQYREQRLLRQNRPMHRAEIALVAFSLQAASAEDTTAHLLQADLTFQHGKRQRRLVTRVMLRQHTYWSDGGKP